MRHLVRESPDDLNDNKLRCTLPLINMDYSTRFLHKIVGYTQWMPTRAPLMFGVKHMKWTIYGNCNSVPKRREIVNFEEKKNNKCTKQKY